MMVRYTVAKIGDFPQKLGTEPSIRKMLGDEKC